MGSATQDATALQQSQDGFLTESSQVMELRYVENLEEVKAKILILEQQLADQSGSKDFQGALVEELVDAREWQNIWERNLGAVRSLRKY